MASRTISSNDWLPHKWGEILFAAALADDHRPNACYDNMAGCSELEHYLRRGGRKGAFPGIRNKDKQDLCTHTAWRWRIKRWDKQRSDLKYYLFNHNTPPTPHPISPRPSQISLFPLPSLSVSLANNPLVSKLLRQPLGTQIALDQANLFCKGDLFNHLIFFGGHLFIWFPRLQRTLRGYSNKAGESNR